MGLFITPNLKEESVEDFVQTAEANIKLWRKNPDSEYLLECFAVNCLVSAARLVRKNEGRMTDMDKEHEREREEQWSVINKQIADHKNGSDD